MIRIPEKKKNKTSRPDHAHFRGWLFYTGLLAGLTYWSQDHVFFWDTIQFAGKHGHWFFEQHFNRLLLPPEIDSGHPPVFGWYLAALWLLFGKSLWVSHWAMFPFLAGIVWQLHGLARLWLRSVPAYWLILIALADPVFLGQSVLVSPDIVLLFFFLWAINSLWRGRSLAFALAALGLVAVSTRGMMIVASLGLYQLLSSLPVLKRLGWKDRLQVLVPYLPAALFSGLFLLIHYRETGWIGYHPDSPWAPAFERADAGAFLRNLAIFAWRWLDYGRIFVWLTLSYLLLRHGPKLLTKPSPHPTTQPPHHPATQPPNHPTIQPPNHPTIQPSNHPTIQPPNHPTIQPSNHPTIQPFNHPTIQPSNHPTIQPFNHSTILLLLLCLTALLSFSFLTYSNLQAHRYLLPAFLTFSLLCVILVDRFATGLRRTGLLWLMFLGLAAGNCWIYPDRIAQGWDATLAHWPYYAARDQILDYLRAAGIPLHTVGTAFPDIGPLKYRDLSGRISGFKEKDLTTDRRILYSNIMNDFSDTEIEELQTRWKVEKVVQRGGIKMILYRKKM